MNKREYEITKHVSLLSLDPAALLQLRQTGRCEVSIPEAVFDLGFPGHYMRRVKSVSISIPCVTGPYIGVNCTLTLLKNSLRNSSILRNGKYMRDVQSDDPRFTDYYGSIQSIVTSSGQNDSGLFETNLRDERYLPFEGAGAISAWRIELSDQFRQFDYDTISDVILHLRYTAREGGSLLTQRATAELQGLLNEFAGKGQARLFSLRQEFPTEWQRFKTIAGASGNHKQVFSLSKARFPFLFQGSAIKITQVDLFGLPASDQDTAQLDSLQVNAPGDSNSIKIENGGSVGQLAHKTANKDSTGADLSVEVKRALGQATSHEADWTLTIGQAELEELDDIFIMCRYQVTAK